MIVGGRFPILVILVLCLVVAATKGVPWILKQLRDPIPVFRVDDVRDARYVAPYDVEWPQTPSGEVAHFVTVHGESVTARYRETMPFRSLRDSSIKPEAVFEAKAGETVTLPDGQTIAISAFVLQPTVLPPGAARDIPFENVYFSAKSEKVTAQEALGLHNRYGRNLGMYRWSEWTNGPAFNLDIEIETNLETDAIAEHSVRDAVTGGSAVLSSSGLRRQTGDEMKLVIAKYQWAAVRPTAKALHLLIRQGEKEVVEFEPVAPQTIALKSGEFNVDAVWTLSQSDRRVTVLSGEQKQGTHITSGGTNTGIELSGLPGAVSRIEARLRNGKRIGGSSSGSAFSFLSEPDDVEAIEVTAYPRLVHVVFHLPELPGVPEENEGKTNVNDMVFPPTVVSNDSEANHLLSTVLQAGMPWSPGPSTPWPATPMDLTGMTVGDFLNLQLARYPEHEFVLTRSSSGSAGISLPPPGTTRQNHFPLLAAVYAFLNNGWHVVLSVAGILVLLKGTVLLRSWALWRSLQARGYRHWTVWDAERAYLGLGRRAWNIPSMDELGTIPGVDATDVVSVVEFLASMKKDE